MRKNKGFTLIELTIVLALLAIIAAIVIPTFILTTDRARLRADANSALAIQRSMELYRIEQGRVVAGNSVDEMLQNLVAAGYVDSLNVVIQSQGAFWQLYQGGIVVNISQSPEAVHRAFTSLRPDEQIHIRGGVVAAGG